LSVLALFEFKLVILKYIWQLFRLWVVYGRSVGVIAFPILLWLGTAASGGGILFGEITAVEGTVGNTNVKNFIIPLWTCSIVMNLIATGMV
jgi:hypothetical protein